jgi:hypothetical protein
MCRFRSSRTTAPKASASKDRGSSRAEATAAKPRSSSEALQVGSYLIEGGEIPTWESADAPRNAMAKNDWKARRFFFPSRDFPDVWVFIDVGESLAGKRLKGGDGYVVMPDTGLAQAANAYIRTLQRMDRKSS